MLYLPEITLVPGESGENVLTLQKLLSARGNYLGERDFTGQYDSVTFNAVWRFQKDYRLYADGIAGPLTIRALNTGRRGDDDAEVLDAAATAGGSIYATYVAAEVLDEVWKEEIDPSMAREEEIQQEQLSKDQKIGQQEIVTQQQLRQNMLDQRELRQQQNRERMELQGKAMDVPQEIAARETLRQQQNLAAQDRSERIAEQRPPKSQENIPPLERPIVDKQPLDKQMPEKQVHVRERVLEQEKGVELDARAKDAQGREGPVNNATQSRGPRLENQVETGREGPAREATVNANQKQQESPKGVEQEKQHLRAEDKGGKSENKDAQVATEKAENIAKGKQDKEASVEAGKGKDQKQQTNEKQVERQKEEGQRELRDKLEGKEKDGKDEKRTREPERKEKPSGISEYDDKNNLHAKLAEKQEKPAEDKSKEDRREEKREARREEKAAERADNPFNKGGITFNGDVKEIPQAPQSGLPMNKAAQGQGAGRVN